jgi:hypothetical protein
MHLETNISLVRYGKKTHWYILLSGAPLKGKIKKNKIKSMCRNIQRKNEREFYIFKMYVFINENANHYFIVLPKFRGETCA